MPCRVDPSHCGSMDMIKNSHFFHFVLLFKNCFFSFALSCREVFFFKSQATKALSLALTLFLISDDSFRKVEEVKIRRRTR